MSAEGKGSNPTLFVLSLWVTIKGKSKRVKALVDSGAELSLYRKGLVPVEDTQDATRPIHLTTADGEAMDGGSTTIELHTLWDKEECLEESLRPTGMVTREELVHEAYEANIHYDVYLGYDFMDKFKLAPFGWRAQLYQELPGKWGWMNPRKGKTVHSVCNTPPKIVPYVYDFYKEYPKESFPHMKCKCERDSTYDDKVHVGTILKDENGSHFPSYRCGHVRDLREKAVPGQPKGNPSKPTPWKTHCYRVTDEWVLDICKHFQQQPKRDAFANEKNNRFPKYSTEETNALAQNWTKEGLLWINPPWELLPQVVGKIYDDAARAIVICPVWHLDVAL